ncbi:MAG: sugar phosphate isomerase/epimerase family protein [Bryobacteraceae bacterium]
MPYTRRTLLNAVAASALAAQSRQPRNWKPKLGILTRYSESNVEFARAEGFTSLQLSVGPGLPADAPDEVVAKVKSTLAKAGLYVSSLMIAENHTAPEPAERAAVNTRFAQTIELAAKLGVPYAGTMSGNMPGRKLAEQVDEIVRVYNEKYFPLCQKHNVKIVWESWAAGPNIATGPVGYEALFKAFGNSPYVGLLFDPSHLQWQFMDPVQCARDFADKIWDVHLKDCEILWHVLRRTGINPLDGSRWWRFRLPGQGIVDWKGFFTVLQQAGYQGAMNIEHEDAFYYPPYDGDNFTEPYKAGFRVAHQFLRQYVPE